jgi:hypothetical protein
MKISLWQQFSSNHSAHFDMVGKFESAERAEVAANELRSMLQTIGKWWERFNPEEQSAIREKLEAKGELTPPEIIFRDQYGINWAQHALDWVLGEVSAEAVRVYRSIVYVSPTANTWAGVKPFDAIVEKLGGQVTVSQEDFDIAKVLTVTIRFSAPDKIVADAVDRSIGRADRAGTNFLYLPIFSNHTPGSFARNDLKMELQRVYLFWPGTDRDKFLNFQRLIAFIESSVCTVTDYEFDVALN